MPRCPNRSLRTLLLAHLLLPLTGCAYNFIPGTWFAFDNLRGNSQPVHLIEHNTEKRLYGADANIYLFFFFWPVEGSMTTVHLFDYRVHSWEFWLPYTLPLIARERCVDDIVQLAEGVSPVWQWGVPAPDHATIRWVLGTQPFIIAMGTEIVPVRLYSSGGLDDEHITLGMTYAMPCDTDLDRTVTELIVLDQWPPPWKNTGSEFDKQFVAELARLTRTIKFDHPTTLREVFAKNLWQQRSLPTAPPLP